MTISANMRLATRIEAIPGTALILASFFFAAPEAGWAHAPWHSGEQTSETPERRNGAKSLEG
jgi:hypothetical protein